VPGARWCSRSRSQLPCETTKVRRRQSSLCVSGQHAGRRSGPRGEAVEAAAAQQHCAHRSRRSERRPIQAVGVAVAAHELSDVWARRRGRAREEVQWERQFAGLQSSQPCNSAAAPADSVLRSNRRPKGHIFVFFCSFSQLEKKAGQIDQRIGGRAERRPSSSPLRLLFLNTFA
jgi:hypothetical protein